MKSCHFKFKPDKIKYLSTIDTLDSSHKNLINVINKKRHNAPNKIKRLDKLEQELYELEQVGIQNSDYITLRSKLLDDISDLKDDIKHIENYDDELEYYVKTHDILLNYYDIIDGQNITDDIVEIQPELEDKISNSDIIIKQQNLDNISYNLDNIINDNSKKNEWDMSEIELFNGNKSSKLDLLNMLSKNKRKDKKTTKKRIKNLECLTNNNNNDIFNYIDGNKPKYSNDELLNINENIHTLKTNELIYIPNKASLFEEYKFLLEGNTNKKKINKLCTNCNIEKILIYSEGIYACLKCGEVENCIVESENNNYKEPMVEKPTFPYKRKNHFCEWNLCTTAHKSRYQKYLLVVIFLYKIIKSIFNFI